MSEQVDTQRLARFTVQFLAGTGLASAGSGTDEADWVRVFHSIEAKHPSGDFGYEDLPYSQRELSAAFARLKDLRLIESTGFMKFRLVPGARLPDGSSMTQAGRLCSFVGDQYCRLVHDATIHFGYDWRTVPTPVCETICGHVQRNHQAYCQYIRRKS